MNQSRRDRPDKIGGIGTFHCRANGVDLQEIAEHHFSTHLLQRLRPGVLAVDHCANIEFEGYRFLDGGPTGVSRGAGDQYFPRHDSGPHNRWCNICLDFRVFAGAGVRRSCHHS
jgi:hypothetical protein